MGHDSELEMWWASLPISQKERIARKAQTKAAKGAPVDESLITYPACSRWWIAQTREKQQAIHDQCVDKHGYLLPEWNDADPYGD